MKTQHLLLSVQALFLSTTLLANVKTDPHFPIGHCYHWLNEGTNKYLRFKYDHAQANNGELTFYTSDGTSNGAVAGPGLYCGKTPGDSYSYGDRVIRIEFVDDVVLYDALSGKQYCGKNGKFYARESECQAKPWDVKFYAGGGVGNYAWYVIRNPQAVLYWTATSDGLIQELNAEKAYEVQSYSIHADNVIRSMKAERAYLKDQVVTNANARLSITTILKDATKLAQTPPLTVIALVASYTGPDLRSQEKNRIYVEQFNRALKDTLLAFSDIISLLDGQQALEHAFVKALLSTDMTELDKINPVLLLQGLDKYESLAKLDTPKAQLIWQAALLSSGGLQSLIDTKLNQDGTFAKVFTSALPSPKALKALAQYNVVAFLQLLDKLVLPGEEAKVKPTFTYLLQELMAKEGAGYIKTFDSLSNTALKKELVLGEIISEIFSSGQAQNWNPLALGLSLDRVTLPSHLKTELQEQILSQSLPVAGTQSYQLLDDLQKGELKLPSFYEEDRFLLKLIDKSVAERGVVKTPTNTFRMIFSGLFHYANDRIRKAGKDETLRKQEMQKAANLMLTITNGLTSPATAEYRYIAFQNSSLFNGLMNYDGHPLESAYALYGKGDVQFDQFFEDIVIHSLDASALQFLVYQDPGQGQSKQLLQMMLQYLQSAEFTQRLKSEEFLASQAEKRQWDNIINNKYYSTKKDGRVPSDICHMRTVIKKNFNRFEKVLGKKDSTDLKSWADDMAKGICVSKS